MEGLQASLESTLLRHFWIVPTLTNRQDQWYKRSYQSWKKENGNLDLYILAPKVSREDWVPEIRSLATAFAEKIHCKADDKYNHCIATGPPSKDKLFADDVMDECLPILGPEYQKNSPLKPSMQQSSYWTRSPRKDSNAQQTYQHAIKALLACEQTDLLCYLACHPQSHVKAAAYVEITSPYSSRCLHIGWMSIIDEMLEMLILLIILKCFREKLILDETYQAWVPFVFDPSSATYGNVTTIKKFTSILEHEGRIIITEQKFQDLIERCYRILVETQILVTACKLPPVEWEQRLLDAVLYFLGFESWNREREDESYLGCKLNVRKDSTWLQKMTILEKKPGQETQKKNMKKARDPLLLLEPKRGDSFEPTKEQEQALEELADLEAREIAYGLKRSTKYHRKSS